MNLKQILAKLKAYPLALSLFGVAILLAGWAYYRSSGAVDDAEQQLAQVTTDNELYNKNVGAGDKIAEHLAELTADDAKFKAALINLGDVIPNQQYFRDTAKDAGVAVGDLAPGLPPEHSKDPVEPLLINFTLSATGRWSEIVSYLYALQTGPHLLRMNLFRLEKSKQIAGFGSGAVADQLVLTLSVEVLGQ